MCGKEWGFYCSLQWGCRCCAHGDGQDAKPGDAPKATSTSLGKRQRSLEFFLLLCFSLLSICAEGNWGCTAVCNGLSVFCRLRWARRQARRCAKRCVAPPCHPAHHHLRYVLLLCFRFLSISMEGNGGFTVVCCVLHCVLAWATH